MNIPCNHSTAVWPTTIAQPVVFILRRQDKVLVKKWLHLRQRVCLGFFESTFICIGHCVMSGLALWVGPQNTPGRATGTTAPSSEYYVNSLQNTELLILGGMSSSNVSQQNLSIKNAVHCVQFHHQMFAWSMTLPKTHDVKFWKRTLT